MNPESENCRTRKKKALINDKKWIKTVALIVIIDCYHQGHFYKKHKIEMNISSWLRWQCAILVMFYKENNKTKS